MAPLCTEDGHAAFYTEEESSSTTMSVMSSSVSSSIAEDEPSSLAITPPARRTVSFSPGAAVHLGAIMHIDDYSQAEKYECWYQAVEMLEIRREVKETVALMNQNVPIDELCRMSEEMKDTGMDVSLSTHGLEGKTRAGKRYRKETRQASLAAVFDEQALQEMDGVFDSTLVAMAYAEYSYPMQVAAFQRAAQHHKHSATLYQNCNNKDDHQSSTETAFTSAVTSSSIDVGAAIGPIKYDFNDCPSTRSAGNFLELEKAEDDFDSASFSVSNDKVASSELNVESVSSNSDKDRILDNHENENSINRPYNIGPLRIRDRFACLLPGSASNSTRSLMGALRVVQI